MVSPSPSSGAAKKLTRQALAGLPIKEFAVHQLASRLDRIETEWSRCAESAGADEIHDLRVSLRRFGEALWLFRRLFPKRERKQVRAELKTALGFAGDTRDVDIAFESFEAGGITLSPELRLHLESERAIAEAALVATLAVGRRTRVIERWRRALALHPDTGFDALAPSDDLSAPQNRTSEASPEPPQQNRARKQADPNPEPPPLRRARSKRTATGTVVRWDGPAVPQAAPPEPEAGLHSPEASAAELLQSDLSEAECLGSNDDGLVPVGGEEEYS